MITLSILNCKSKKSNDLFDKGNQEFITAKQHKLHAWQIYNKIYFSKKPQEIIDNINYLTTVYPFFKESLFAMWTLFNKLFLFKQKHVHMIVQVYFKYMDIYSNCKYNQMFFEKLIIFLMKNQQQSFQDDLLSVFFHLSKRVESANFKKYALDAIVNQIVLCINEQTNTIATIKKCLDVIRDPNLGKISSIIIYSYITLIKEYVSLKSDAIALCYFFKLLDYMNFNNAHKKLPQETKYLLSFLLLNKHKYVKQIENIKKPVISLIDKNILPQQFYQLFV